MHDAEPRYSRDFLTGLVFGETFGAFGHREVPSWALLRSGIEHRGDVESEAFATVMDIERALRMLGSRPIMRDRREMGVVREAKQAAAILSCVLLLDWDATDFTAAFRRGTPSDRLIRKGIAWMSAYLSGATLTEADHAFRKTR